jgi:hypothetical protein
VNRDRRVGVIAGFVGIGDVAKQLVALDDVQADAFFGRGVDAENHVVAGDHRAKGQRLVVGHLDVATGRVREPAQLFEINHTHTPHN